MVSGWPGLLVDGYDAKQKELTLLRMDRLSANVLICLFAGKIEAVDIHQKPETIHFGLDKKPEDGSFYKQLRNQDGELQKDLKIDSIPWKKDEDKRVVNIQELATDINNRLQFPTFTSAQFALEAIQGVEMVRFKQHAGE